MALTPGSRLGVYDITAPIGEGGMGQVYRARDMKLGRDVALKILPDTVAQDADRIARFTREAQVLAALNHPHIAAIYGLEESGGVTALVMELVEGEDLSQRIAKGAIPLDEALPVAKQIAEALEAAHEQGIIHRDLKPANIKLRADGTVKVLDFGLAKAMEPAAGSSPSMSMSPTLTTPAMTQAGMILGTAAYMSPEQAKGRAADKRSDVWAFGVVLYEMLTGQRAFPGEDVSDTLAFILTREPDWAALPAGTPAPIRKLLRRCLEKDRKRRLADAADARLEIEEALTAPWGADVAAAPSAIVPRRWIVATASVALLVGVAAAALATWMLKPAPAAPRHVTRFSLVLPSGLEFTSQIRRTVAMSPDGTQLAFVANNQIYVRAFDQADPVPIRGTSGNPTQPFFSPDGQWIGFYAAGQLKKIALSGGAPVAICEVGIVPYSVSWTGDAIYFDQGSRGIFTVAAAGGTPVRVVAPDEKRAEILAGPQLLPGGTALLFASRRGSLDDGDIVVQSLKAGERKTVVHGGSDPHYVEGGYLIYARDSVLFAQPFDLAKLETHGGAVTVAEQIQLLGPAGYNFSISASGTLASVSGAYVDNRTLAWVDRRGHEEPIPAPPRAYWYPRLSPDGSRLVVDAHDQETDIWMWDFVGARLTRLTFGPATEYYPVWMPDGRRIVYSSTADSPFQSVYAMSVDRPGSPERLTTASDGNQFPNAISPDGHALVLYLQAPKTSNDVAVLSLDGTKALRTLVGTPFSETSADLSPDGRWLAYQSDASGRNEVYVRPYPNVDESQHAVSADGGTWPAWSHDGKELFYVGGDGRLVSAPVTLAPNFSAGRATALFDMRPYSGQTGRMYDVSRDGQRFLVVKSPAGMDTRIQIVEHWAEELKAHVPTK